MVEVLGGSAIGLCSPWRRGENSCVKGIGVESRINIKAELNVVLETSVWLARYNAGRSMLITSQSLCCYIGLKSGPRLPS